MKRNSIVIFLAASMLLGFYILYRINTAQAQRPSARDNEVIQKWDYCAIVSSSNMRDGELAAGIATIVYFEPSGYRKEVIKVQGEKLSAHPANEYLKAQQKVFAMAIAQLGSQGWELIGEIPYNGAYQTEMAQRTGLYFKRMKR